MAKLFSNSGDTDQTKHSEAFDLDLHHLPVTFLGVSLQKHAYSYILKILPSKNENFQIKNSNIFHISAQNIDCRYSLEPPRRGTIYVFEQK